VRTGVGVLSGVDVVVLTASILRAAAGKHKPRIGHDLSVVLYDWAMLDTNRLRVFRAVIAEGSVVRAAANLGYTPSAVSQQLSALQRQTGLPLLERRGRGIVPTAVGLRFADESAAVLEQLARLESFTADLRAGRVGSLVISYFASAGATWIPPIVAGLSREFPGLRLDLRLSELGPLPGSAPDVEIYVDGSEAPDPAGYDLEPLLTEPYLVVMPADHRLAGRERVALAELAEESWVDNDVARGPCRQVLLDACAASGFSPGFHIETQDYPTAIAFVAAGAGITVLPQLGLAHPGNSAAGVGRTPASVAVATLVDPTPTRSITVRSRQGLRNNPAVQRLLHLLRDEVASRQPG
jgi:DNA-binding transcriptional LysR family regulator